MNPLIKYGVAVLLVLGALFGAYRHGVSTTADKYEARIAKLDKTIADHRTAHANQRTAAEQKERVKEKAHADAISAIDTKHQKEIHERETSTQRTIAGLRDGSLRLRDKFTRCERASNSPAGEAGASASSDHGSASVPLQIEDAQLLILWADDADRVADQLRACQAIVKADREPKES